MRFESNLQVGDVIKVNDVLYTITDTNTNGNLALFPMKDIRVGDIVEIIDQGKFYPSADELLQNITSDVNYYIRYAYNNHKVSNFTNLEVLEVGINRHNEKKMLLVGSSDDCGRVFLISEDGVRFVRHPA